MSNPFSSDNKGPIADAKSSIISPPKRVISRVPNVTFVFWIIKCLATALGETMAD